MMLKFVKEKISIPSGFSMLDLGCGPGGITMIFSRICEKIVAMDISPDRIKLTNTHIKNENIANAFAVRSDGANLPFKDNAFNLVIVNGVLEYIPILHAQNPQKMHSKALSEVKRVLKNGGFLYLGIENRYFFSYLLGKMDHSKLRFAAVLPRKIANFYSKLLKKRLYKTYIYSYWRLIHLLYDAGFSSMSFYVPFPTYRIPALVAGILDKKELLDAIKAKQGKLGKTVTKFVVLTGLTKLFIHDFIVIARRNEDFD